MVGGVASNTLAIPGVPSGQTVSNPIPACATYQLDDWSPSPMDDFRSIEAGRFTSPAGQGLAFTWSYTTHPEFLRIRFPTWLELILRDPEKFTARPFERRFEALFVGVLEMR